MRRTYSTIPTLPAVMQRRQTWRAGWVKATGSGAEKAFSLGIPPAAPRCRCYRLSFWV